MERFGKIVNGFLSIPPKTQKSGGFLVLSGDIERQPLIIFAKNSIVDVWQGTEYASEIISITKI